MKNFGMKSASFIPIWMKVYLTVLARRTRTVTRTWTRTMKSIRLNWNNETHVEGPADQANTDVPNPGENCVKWKPLQCNQVGKFYVESCRTEASTDQVGQWPRRGVEIAVLEHDLHENRECSTAIYHDTPHKLYTLHD